jgi:aerobic-type carbon monoxide dehydrogenase small subunit (CoxS/CutS family)
MKTNVSLRVNGRALEGMAEPRTSLGDFLRHELGLTGTHLGCEHGVCGACTVLVDGVSVRSCLMFAVQAQNCDVLTIEAPSEWDRRLYLLKRAFHAQHALQCGFCTPGFLMTLTEFLRENAAPTETEVRDALSGNICRCTGYQPIVAAVLEAAELMRAQPE